MRQAFPAAVLDESGKLVMQAVLPTKDTSVLSFLRGLRGTLRVTFEEGTHAAWLHQVLQSQGAEVVVCDPRRNALLKSGNKNDRIDAHKLAALRANMLKPVYHDDTQTLTLKGVGRSYRSLTDDCTRVMRRLKALYRSLATDTGGKKLYSKRRREQWIHQLQQPGQRYRAERLFEQFEQLKTLRRQVRGDLINEGHKHAATTAAFPLGPIRSALLIARVQRPFRFRTKRQFWA